jgi:5-oxoprolinase (ATP-hydrolysing) subunit A
MLRGVPPEDHHIDLNCDKIDLNCDMGEGMDTDEAIFPFISSANIACGYHAGNADMMRHTIALALEHQVAIGAHPSYPDRENFGRKDILGTTLREEDLPAVILDQLVVLQTICGEFGTRLHHVKPHGALYNRAAKDARVSALICRVIRDFDPALHVYGLSGSEMKEQTERYGLRFIPEVFADRTYQDDGSLTPRTNIGALIDDPTLAVMQVLKMVREGRVVTINGKEIPLLAGTVCIHGDGSHAAAFAQMISGTLRENGIAIQSIS